MNEKKIQPTVRLGDKVNTVLLAFLFMINASSLFFYNHALVNKGTLLVTTAILGILFFVNFKLCEEKVFLLILLLNIVSMGITVIQYSGIGCAIITVNLLLSFFIFNNMELPKTSYILACLPYTLIVILYLLTGNLNGAVGTNDCYFVDYFGNELNPNMYGMLSGIAFIGLVCMVDKIGNSRAMEWAKLAVMLVLLVPTYRMLQNSAARTAQIMVLAFVFLYIVARFKISYTLYRTGVIVGLLLSLSFCVMLLLVYRNDNAYEMFRPLFTGRQKLWTFLTEFIERNTLLGSGSVAIEHLEYFLGTTSPHNMLLGEWAILGVIPTASVICLAVNKLSIKERKNMSRVGQLAFLSTLVLPFFESSYLESYLYMLMVPFLLTNVKTETVEEKSIKKDFRIWIEIGAVVAYLFLLLPVLNYSAKLLMKDIVFEEEILSGENIVFDVEECRVEGEKVVFTGYVFGRGTENMGINLLFVPDNGEKQIVIEGVLKEGNWMAEQYFDTLAERVENEGFVAECSVSLLNPNICYELQADYYFKKEYAFHRMCTDTKLYLYQGELYYLNPKTFITPDVSGAEIEGVVKDGRCLEYNSEHKIWAYKEKELYYYIIDINSDIITDEGVHCICYAWEKQDADEHIYRDLRIEKEDMTRYLDESGRYLVVKRKMPKDGKEMIVKLGVIGGRYWKYLTYLYPMVAEGHLK